MDPTKVTSEDIKLLEHDFKVYQESLDLRTERIARLPKLSHTVTPAKEPANSAEDNGERVCVFREINGNYERLDNDKENSSSNDRNVESKTKRATAGINDDPLKDESILMLESKIKPGEEVYAMLHTKKPWIRCKIACIFRRPFDINSKKSRNKPIITIRVRALQGADSKVKDVDKFAIARIQDHKDRLRPTKRVIAGFITDEMMPGIIGNQPSEETKNRYLVLLDDGSANYYTPKQVYPIFGQSAVPWLDARYLNNPNDLNAAYLRHYLSSWPKRLLMCAEIGVEFELVREGNLVPTTLIGIDCDIIRVRYSDGTEENIHRGSPRLLKRNDVISRQLVNLTYNDHFSDQLILFMKLYYDASRISLDEDLHKFSEDPLRRIILAGDSNLARKSTGARSNSPKVKVRIENPDLDVNRDEVEHLDSDRLQDNKQHKCTPDCLSIPDVKTETSVLNIRNEFRHVSDLKVPLMLGWKRKFYRIPISLRNNRHKTVIFYVAPCGKLFQQPHSIKNYLYKTNSILDVDYFTFDRDISLNYESQDFEAYYYSPNIAIDSETNQPLENKNISLVNQFNHERLPVDFEYRNECFPHPMLKANGFSFNHEFKSGCDCEDDCGTRPSCACHRLNEDAYGSNTYNKGMVEKACQYYNKRISVQVATGIFECNSFCKCSSKCGNRVVQNGIKFRLQVRKTIDKGWSVATLDDIPTGAYICTYSAELLDDADKYGDSDMYYADLDYITVNEAQKLGYNSDRSDEGVELSESDDDDRSKDGDKRKRLYSSQESEFAEDSSRKDDEESSEASLDNTDSKYMPRNVDKASRYPKRRGAKQHAKQHTRPAKAKPADRPPQYKRIHDILGSSVHTLDARMQGNVGRFLNHSCDPNAFVQNVFIQTHDLRFPVVAFFANRMIKANEEVTWNYNYKMGCIPGRRIDCYCKASNCRGRIL